MPSTHKDPRGKSKYWFAAFRDATNKRCFRSTHTTDQKQAEEIARTWHHSANLKKTGKLNPDTARQVIKEGISRMFSDQGMMPSSSVEDFATRWLSSKKLEVTPTSFIRYEGVVQRFKDFLGDGKKRDVATIAVAEITRFRDEQARKLSLSSARLSLKILRTLFGEAHRQGLVSQNPAGFVRQIKIQGESKRRPFTIPELKRVLNLAKGSEMEGLILCGIYTGQRLGDLARLRWRQVDLSRREISFITRKTGRRMPGYPLAKPLEDYLTSLPSSDNPDSPVFPESFKRAKNKTSALSKEFYLLLVGGGLAEKRTNKSTGKGRNACREVSPLSFHCIRHSTTTLLKAAGVSDVLAREFVGHESESISRVYTHLTTEHLRGAVDALPDVTAKAGSKK